MAHEIVLPEQSRRSYDTFHFAPAAWSQAGLLFCSGVIGTDRNGKIPDMPEEEFENAWLAVKTVLDEAGLHFSDILELTTYHVGLHEHLSAFTAVKDRTLSAPWPAWTAIGITELAIPDARVEIRVVAQRN